MSGQYQDPYGGRPQYAEPAYTQPYNDQYEHQASASSFQANASTEKMVDGPLGTERHQRGRQGLQSASKSWANGPPPRSTGILRMWRKGERGKQWSRGGGWRMFFRLCCCCSTFAFILVVSIILTIALYVRPPNLRLNNINLGNGGVDLSNDGFSVPLSLNISVANPNWFSINFREITTNVRYPGSNTNTFGGGTVFNADFVGYSEVTFNFPLTLNYSTAIDPNKVILNDLINKCGNMGGSNQITINYDLLLKLRIVDIIISPKITSDATFACPISSSDINKIAGNSS